MKKIKLSLIISFAAVMIFSNCNKAVTSTTEILKEDSPSEISLENGVLKFKNFESYNQVLQKLEQNENVVLPKGFVSLYDVYNEVKDAEYKVAQQNYSKTKTINNELHSQLFKDNEGSVFYTKLENGTSILDMDVYSRGLAMLVNKKGLVIVNDSLLIYSRYKADACTKYDKSILEHFNKTDYKATGIEATPFISIKKSEERPAPICSFCYKDSYHYNTTVWNGITSYQVICEVYVEQLRYGCGVTESYVKARARFLTRFPTTGSFIPFYSTDMYFSGAFSGPRSPGWYNQSNPFNSLPAGYGTDKTVQHCWDQSIGNTNCFSVDKATYKIVTSFAPFTPTTVTWQ